MMKLAVPAAPAQTVAKAASACPSRHGKGGAGRRLFRAFFFAAGFVALIGSAPLLDLTIGSAYAQQCPNGVCPPPS
jgi:hypothetical protein